MWFITKLKDVTGMIYNDAAHVNIQVIVWELRVEWHIAMVFATISQLAKCPFSIPAIYYTVFWPACKL